jgi:hypothetical protein
LPGRFAALLENWQTKWRGPRIRQGESEVSSHFGNGLHARGRVKSQQYTDNVLSKRYMTVLNLSEKRG